MRGLFAIIIIIAGCACLIPDDTEISVKDKGRELMSVGFNQKSNSSKKVVSLNYFVGFFRNGKETIYFNAVKNIHFVVGQTKLDDFKVVERNGNSIVVDYGDDYNREILTAVKEGILISSETNPKNKMLYRRVK